MRKAVANDTLATYLIIPHSKNLTVIAHTIATLVLDGILGNLMVRPFTKELLLSG